MLTRSQHHRHADTIAQLNPNQPTHNPRIRQNNPTHPENVLQPNDRERKNQKSKIKREAKTSQIRYWENITVACKWGREKARGGKNFKMPKLKKGEVWSKAHHRLVGSCEEGGCNECERSAISWNSAGAEKKQWRRRVLCLRAMWEGGP